MLKFTKIWEDINTLNNDKNKLFPSLEDYTPEEYGALVGRYAESHTRYDNPTQFKMAFFTIDIEARPRLRAKLRANDMLRNLEEDEVLEGGISIVNSATNPDTAPSTEAFGIRGRGTSLRMNGSHTPLNFYPHQRIPRWETQPL